MRPAVGNATFGSKEEMFRITGERYVARPHRDHEQRRGIDVFNGAYQILVLTPKGRDEGNALGPMFWIRRHNQH